MEKPDLNKPAFKMMPKAADFIKRDKCPLCGKDIKEKDFKDALSRKEYGISGMCQRCQNKTFKE